ncbi:hypothetical protein AAZX31_07G228500 [Glycine max]|uniref:Uncharacterized protein n=2 Tax=Glycine subgen. Soja TaxID=1462606 RepID=I1KMX6_SOYBN|nr:uncharacterized protein LOC100802982 [Glycine max]XP_028241671.1 uncharacterized protein LOC114420032 [Glycine soja]KAG5038930.1 hypothetical protein JHK86_019770 [Glycine max]KAG5144058.1 hypothetical protein JHK82_019753 [Glycine max]KAH1088450.1 hypothetical protein GYH30_019477 [Glycine max]KAH1243616.1 hypothetical protein GmHk_07G020660 [Glycine max]KHN02957.1 hypothetical protein glysoja_009823 [Glycine soja]|eukprot:XP_003528634.1 uncharacterized protein LOC100802982 [Glycine max]
MEAMKGARVGVGEDHDMPDGMQCSDHPYRNNPGGICAFCLQDKLGKLVSSSFPLPILPPSSPSFRSHLPPSSLTPAASSAPAPSSSSSSSLPINNPTDYQYYPRRTRLPFLLPKKKKKKPPSATSDNIVLKRSKSTATPRRNHSLVVDDDDDDEFAIGGFSPRKRNGFWSFLYLSSKSSKKLNSKSFRDHNPPRISTINSAPGSSSSVKLKDKRCSGSSLKTDIVVEQDNTNSPNTASASASSFERKVSRSRSVGCGSRSFSGDFFERISTGFGDCTLRRVESQREGKPKGIGGGSSAVSRGGEHHHHHHCMKERVRCGGLFSGFMMTSSSSSSSSSSYWVSSSADDAAAAAAVNGKSATVALSHNRGRSWGWAFASPMRAFSGKPSSKESNRRDIIRGASDKNATPNLSAIPSLLAVRG